MDRETRVRLGVAASGAAPVTARRAMQRAGSWRAAAARAARDAQMPPRLRDAFGRAEDLADVVLERCAATGTQPWLRGSPDWPVALEQLADPPEVLFTRGRRSMLSAPAVAFVGAREASDAGRDWTFRVAEELAGEGWTIGSGLARGIDTAAHQGARAQGDTFAVLGCGPDVPYPAENRRLHAALAEDGLLLSEFAPGTEPRAHHFPRRNRILAALTLAVVVVECRHRSGALVTARHALDLGREVLAVPGFPGSPLADGPLQLLRDGARLVRHAEDLREDLGGLSGLEALASRRAAPLPEDGARSPEELAERLGLDDRAAREEWARRELRGLAPGAGSPRRG